ncbi:Replication initiation protein, partial [Streptomyces sp. 2MCAF27]
SDTTLVISHWQYAGTGLLPELEHLADLLAATPQTRPEQPTRTRRSKRSGDRAGHPVGHSTDRLTSAVRAGAVA